MLLGFTRAVALPLALVVAWHAVGRYRTWRRARRAPRVRCGPRRGSRAVARRRPARWSPARRRAERPALAGRERVVTGSPTPIS
ncbi:hypothetical protein NKG05_23535 [Oerskovia sp. M15]